ncbi:EVE domain-containing protein [Mariniblastus sp.]|nr:EVE domain-containing protein [Mariniblastus sp.]
MKSQQPLIEALATFDRASFTERVEKAELQRQAILDRFPRDQWGELELTDYALGQSDKKETFCYLLEYGSKALGSLKGGSAAKHIVYKHKKKQGWFYPDVYENETTAWVDLRAGFLKLFEYAEAENWLEIDEIAELRTGPALRTKTLHVYFPSDVLPIYSIDHVRHFLNLLDLPVESGYSVVRHNQRLLKFFRADERFSEWTTVEIMYFLYDWANPRKAPKVFKIAPGDDAKYWEDCQQNNFICIGWEKVGDLTEFENKAEFKEAFFDTFDYSTKNKASQKANELWKLMEFEEGDIIVVNKGISQILAVGTVNDKGYEFLSSREEYNHTLGVDWDTSYAKEITPQRSWAFLTVAKVKPALYKEIMTGETMPVIEDDYVDEIYYELEDALNAKGQVIMYGPPGTGKTFHARRFAVWWLLFQNDQNGAAVINDYDRFRETEERLSTAQTSNKVWWAVANPKEWSWDQLEKEKTVDFRYGRLKRNYSKAKVGDLVVGYQATPDKKIVAIAKVCRELSADENGDTTIGFEFVTRIENGLTYAELQEDEVLSKAEPLIHRCQGTLFSLSEIESQHLFSLLAERGNGDLLAEDSRSVGQLTRVTFHASYSYEDFIEGFRPVATNSGNLNLQLRDGVFKRICQEAILNPDRQFLVVIDEINRANITKVFGELITLLEIDKRGMSVTLPQSNDSFRIPENVSLIATMNTADRSIKLLDAALRRRFSFIEMMPDSTLLEGAMINSLSLDLFLTELNRRVSVQFGPEKQVGHSFLMQGEEAISEPDEFARRFRQDILPLLQEYCFDDYITLAGIIGEGFVDTEAYSIDKELLKDAEQLLIVLSKEFLAKASDE